LYSFSRIKSARSLLRADAAYTHAHTRGHLDAYFRKCNAVRAAPTCHYRNPGRNSLSARYNCKLHRCTAPGQVEFRGPENDATLTQLRFIALNLIDRSHLCLAAGIKFPKRYRKIVVGDRPRSCHACAWPWKAAGPLFPLPSRCPRCKRGEIRIAKCDNSPPESTRFENFSFYVERDHVRLLSERAVLHRCLYLIRKRAAIVRLSNVLCNAVEVIIMWCCRNNRFIDDASPRNMLRRVRL